MQAINQLMSTETKKLTSDSAMQFDHTYTLQENSWVSLFPLKGQADYFELFSKTMGVNSL
jgi:predicted glycosyltransferase involved in capsule biosynthesis